jgi:predicted phage terminase large subunit-like protein
LSRRTLSPTIEPPSPEDLAFSRLICFGRYINPDFIHPWHIRLLARKLEEAEKFGGRRIIIAVPPRHGKSFLGSQLFPPWFLGRNPSKYIISVSYGDELALDMGRVVRNYMKDPNYLRVFPGVALARDSTSSGRFNTAQGGAYFAAGVGGPITGRGAHVLIADDTIKNWKEAQSKVVRKHLINWFLSTAFSRLQKGGSVILINTRWHDEDLAGYLLKHDKGNDWEEIVLPALNENDEALVPEFFSAIDLIKIRKTLGSRIFAPLYQGRPQPEEGGIIKKTWFKRYSTLPVSRPLRIVQSWDTAVKDDQLNDYSVCTTWWEFFGKYFLIDVLRGRWAYPDLKREVRGHQKKHKPDVILIEDKGSGSTLIQEMQIDDHAPVLAITPTDSKLVRFVRASPRIEAGMVFLPEEASWLAEYESELVGFPTMEHDDQVDSTSQALDYMSRIFFSGLAWEELSASIELMGHWDFYASVFWRHDLRMCAVLYFGVSEDRTVFVFAEEAHSQVLPKVVAERILSRQKMLPPSATDKNTRKTFHFVLGNPDLWAKRGVGDSTAQQFADSGVYLRQGYDDQRQGLIRVREYQDAGKLKISPDCRFLITSLKTLIRQEKDQEKADSDNLTLGRFIDALWNFLLSRPLSSDVPKEEPVFPDNKSRRAFEALQALRKARKNTGI